MKKIATTLIALMVLTSVAYAQNDSRTVQESSDAVDAVDAVDAQQMKRLRLLEELDGARGGNSITLSNSAFKTTNATPDLFRFEMTANGSGQITGQTGFDVTIPTGVGAYSADWFRDVEQSPNSPPTILTLPNGMQDAGGWYFIVAGGGFPDFDGAVGRWTRNGLLNSTLDGNTYEIRFTSAGGKALMEFTSRTLVDVPFELWFLGSSPDEPSDDVRMVASLFDDNFNDVFDFHLDQPADDEFNDPGSDWIYLSMPADDSPGQAGYEAWVDDPFELEGPEHMARVVLMNWDQHQGETVSGAGDGLEGAAPEPGTTIRITAEIPPTCLLAINAGPPASLVFTIEDGGGLATIDVVGTTNANVDVPVFTPGENTVIVTVTQSDPSVWGFGADLEVTDTDGLVAACEQADDLENLAIHNVGNTILALQPNSALGTFPLPIPGFGINALWPRDGFVDHLFYGALWVGAVVDSEIRVMDNWYDGTDWTQTSGFTNVPGLSDQGIGVTYDDQSPRYSSAPIGLEVLQRSFQWSHPLRDDFIIFTYTFENTGLSGDLTDVFAAQWLDPDIGFLFNDQVGFDGERGLIYQFDDPAEGGHLGLKVVGSAPHSVNACFGFDDDSRYSCMEDVFPLPDFRGDQRIMVTAQPFDLAVGETHSVAFGVVMGADLAALQANADMMDDVLDIPNTIQYVEELGLSDDLEQSFRAMLEEAQASLNKGNTNAALGKLNAFINHVQAQRGKALTETDADLLIFLAQTILGNINSDGFAKLGESGNVEELPTSYQLSQNYPNPFNPSTTIAFDLPASSNVRLVVFDLLGREVARLVDTEMPAGKHAVTWAAGGVPSGLYLYRIDADDFSQTRQMVLLK